MTDSPFFRQMSRLGLILAAALLCLPSHAAPGIDRQERPLSMKDYRMDVASFNESIHIKLLELEINRRRLLAAEAAFIPALVMGAEHVQSNRPNTVEERRSQGGISNFDERNYIYSTGLEWLVPSGATVGFRYMLRDLNNNLQGSDSLLFPSSSSGEFVTFTGLELTQPLLRDRGGDATLAAIRIAAGESRLAYEDFRRDMMMILSAAELAYWNLHFAQEQHRFWNESLGLARRVLDDQEAALEAGRGSELEVLTARAAVAERRARQAEAWQQRLEASNAAASFFSLGPARGVLLVATESPRTTLRTPSLEVGIANARRLNPDYLSQVLRLDMDETRVAYARNQALPRVDLTASAGFNGLGNSIGSSFDDITDGSYPAWSVGLRLRMPLNNSAANNLLAAERLRHQKTALGIDQITLQIESALDNAIARIAATREAAESFTAATEVNRRILETQLESLSVGRGNIRTVIEAESDLFASMVAGLRNEIQLARAAIEFELHEGTLLANRNLETDREQISRQTAAILENNRWNPEQYQRFLSDFNDSLRGGGTP